MLENAQKKKRTTNNPTVDDIKQAIHKVDLINRPYIAFLHPDDAETVKAILPRIEEEVVIQPTSYVERGKGVAIKREDLESWAAPRFGDLFKD